MGKPKDQVWMFEMTDQVPHQPKSGLVLLPFNLTSRVPKLNSVLSMLQHSHYHSASLKLLPSLWYSFQPFAILDGFSLLIVERKNKNIIALRVSDLIMTFTNNSIIIRLCFIVSNINIFLFGLDTPETQPHESCPAR